MKIAIAGNQLTVTSDIKVEDIALVKKYSPDALEIKDDKKNTLFAIGYSEGKGSISKFGVTFGGASLTGDGSAQVTVPVPAGTTPSNVKEQAADLVAPITAYLAQLEVSVPQVVADINAYRTALKDTITVA